MKISAGGRSSGYAAAMNRPRIVIVGAGINGLVAANYLQRAGCDVSMVERAERVGGACVSATANVDGVRQDYALGASVLGLMQDFVFSETGLAERLETYVPDDAKLVYFPGDSTPTRIYRNSTELDAELAERWGESGEVEAFRADEEKVVDFLIRGYRDARPPSIDDANAELGPELTSLWISGSARQLMDHYLTSERSKIYMAMTVTESGPVSLDDPYSAFTLPLMDSGTIFGSYYGFVKGGIWRITEELGRINEELGVKTHLSSPVEAIDAQSGRVSWSHDGQKFDEHFDHIVFATDPLSAARLNGDSEIEESIAGLRFRGSSGKLNLMFQKPVRWKHAGDTDTPFRFRFSVDSLEDFEAATTAVMDEGNHYVPGYAQIYCEGAAMRQLGFDEPFDRLAVFFKNLALDQPGEELPEVRDEIRATILELIENPEDCSWQRLLTPADLRETFLFPGGNLDHTMLTGGQTYFDRSFSSDPASDFYRFGEHENVHICGSGTYPCGSVTGTPGYMCAAQLLGRENLSA